MPSSCGRPEDLLTYESLTALDEFARIKATRDTYCGIAGCLTAEIDGGDDSTETADRRDNYEAICYNLNILLLDATDGVATNEAELMATHWGEFRDELSLTTRRSYPLGRVLEEISTYLDGIDVTETADISTFVLSDEVVRVITDPDYADIAYEDSVTTEDAEVEVTARELKNFEKASDTFELDDKESCVDIPCTFYPEIEVDDLVAEEPIDLDATSDLTDEDLITLFQSLMCTINANIQEQFTHNRLDAKTFGDLYGSVIATTLASSVEFTTKRAALDIEAKKLQLEQDNNKYTAALAKAQAEVALVQAEIAITKLPLEMDKLGQDVKLVERQVIHTRRQVEQTKASTRATYDTMAEGRKTSELEREQIKAATQKIKKDTAEITANGVKERRLTSARTENTRVDTRVKRVQGKVLAVDRALKQAQVKQTDVRTSEERATGASNRRVNNAEVQTKNKIASLYNEQRKGLVRTHRERVLNIAVNAWATQLENLGGENMVIEGIKGAELSSRFERTFLDAGI